jgi:hypothetical protein
MKKMLFAGLAIAAMAALGVSCQKNALQTPEGRRAVSFEASIASAPGTKFSMTDEGTYVKASWEVGDEIAVLWYAGTEDVTVETYEKFTVTAVSSDGKSATFSNESSAFPASGEVTAMFVYPYLAYNDDYHGYIFSTPDFTAASVQAPAANAVYYAKADVKDGSIPSLTFAQQNSFLFIKQGTKITGVTEGDRWLKISGVKYAGVARKGTGDNLEIMRYAGIDVGRVEEGIQFVKDGDNMVLGQDVWIPFFPDGATTSLKVEVIDPHAGGGTEYTSSVWDSTPAVGKVYDLSGKF